MYIFLASVLNCLKTKEENQCISQRFLPAETVDRYSVVLPQVVEKDPGEEVSTIACCEIRAARIPIARILLSTALSQVPDGGFSHGRVQLYSEVGAEWVSIGT